jgi:FtsH-binding integral membrane protein
MDTSFDTNNDFCLAKKEYIAKTFQTLFFQFLFTFGSVFLVAFNDTAHNFMLSNAEKMLVIGGLGGIITILYISFSNPKVELQLAVFTVFETMVVCVGAVLYSWDVVMLALLATFSISSFLGFYALSTKTDYTQFGNALFSALMSLLMISLAGLFLGIEMIHTVSIYFGTLVFFGYIIYDVQHYFSNDAKLLNEHGIKQDLHIEAAINIYLDVINVFIRMLEIIDRLKNKGENKRNRR